MPCSSLRQGMITVMLFDLYTPKNPSYHVVMKFLPFALLVFAGAITAENVALKQVQSVYILPMRSGMDQYLANKIVRHGTLQVVTDPQRADAILTDHIGATFERKLDELYPPPRPAAPVKPAKADKDDDEDTADTTDKPDSSKKGLIEVGAPTDHTSSFGGGRGTVFLVDRKSRAVIWSTYDRAHDMSADSLDKKADQIVNRLKSDLKEKK